MKSSSIYKKQQHVHEAQKNMKLMIELRRVMKRLRFAKAQLNINRQHNPSMSHTLLLFFINLSIAVCLFEKVHTA